MINITEAEREIIVSIIEKNLPRAKVLAFGSRVRGTNAKSSDLDLAFDNNGVPLTIRQRGQLSEDFSESNLPYCVDIVDLCSVSESFKGKIDLENEILYGGI